MAIIDFKVISVELLSSTDIFKAQAFGIYQVVKVVIIYKNEDLVFVIF